MIKNREKILENAYSKNNLKLRKDVTKILEEAIESVEPKVAIFNEIKKRDNNLLIKGKKLSLKNYTNIYVIGGGKAGGAMAEAIEQLLHNMISEGIVNILRGTKKDYTLNKIVINEASHPIPDESGVAGVKNMLKLADKANEDDLFIVLISGGGSALMPCPVDGISLDDLRMVTDLLLKSGATINELNAVRKHISTFKGGQLAKRCYPAEVLSIILSDVIGDPIDTIASGPTAPDKTTYKDSLSVLKRRELLEKTPKSVRSHLLGGLEGRFKETPKKGDRVFDKVTNLVVANNMVAAKSSKEMAAKLGYNSMILSTMIEGEARHIGTAFTGIAREIYEHNNPLQKPAAVVVGGETTVTVRGNGVGGRNQELALSFARRVNGLNCLIATLATDGIDGPSDAAGAIVDGGTLDNALKNDLQIERYLDNNDSFNFFKKIGDLIITGPTGTNVNDLAIILVGK